MKELSKFRKSYIARLVIRSLILIITILLYIFKPEYFEVAKGFNFIKNFSPLHILWLIWMIDMILQLCKVPKYWPLGSQKYWANRFIPDLKEIDLKQLKKRMKEMSKDVIPVAITWLIITGIIDGLYLFKIIPYEMVAIASTVFYVCDVICVIIWCPFRHFFMHNKCCTTCRIFNWDHAMMFLPLVVIPGLWTYSLVLTSWLILIVWETICFNHPERFYEETNCALRCQNCKDKLCGKK